MRMQAPRAHSPHAVKRTPKCELRPRRTAAVRPALLLLYRENEKRAPGAAASRCACALPAPQVDIQPLVPEELAAKYADKLDPSYLGAEADVFAKILKARPRISHAPSAGPPRTPARPRRWPNPRISVENPALAQPIWLDCPACLLALLRPCLLACLLARSAVSLARPAVSLALCPLAQPPPSRQLPWVRRAGAGRHQGDAHGPVPSQRRRRRGAVSPFRTSSAPHPHLRTSCPPFSAVSLQRRSAASARVAQQADTAVQRFSVTLLRRPGHWARPCKLAPPPLLDSWSPVAAGAVRTQVRRRPPLLPGEGVLLPAQARHSHPPRRDPHGVHPMTTLRLRPRPANPKTPPRPAPAHSVRAGLVHPITLHLRSTLHSL